MWGGGETAAKGWGEKTREQPCVDAPLSLLRPLYLQQQVYNGELPPCERYPGCNCNICTCRMPCEVGRGTPPLFLAQSFWGNALLDVLGEKYTTATCTNFYPFFFKTGEIRETWAKLFQKISSSSPLSEQTFPYTTLPALKRSLVNCLQPLMG